MHEEAATSRRRQTMKTPTIKSKWLSMTKTGRLDEEFWLKVLQTAAARKIDTTDDNAMQQLIREVEKVEPLKPM
jgi:hypothetical protein